MIYKIRYNSLHDRVAALDYIRECKNKNPNSTLIDIYNSNGRCKPM